MTSAKYNPDGWSEKASEANVGDITEGVVTEIEEGTLGGFVKSWEKFDSSGESKKDQPAIMVKTSAKGASLMIALPPNGVKEYHTRSKMAQYVRTYKKPPFVGQKVKAMCNEDGFYNLILAK